MEVPAGLVLCKEQRRAPEERCLLTFKSPLVERKLTCCKMEICPGPRESALGMTLFILQTESLKREKQSQGRSRSSGAAGRAVPRTSVWVLWSSAIWKNKLGNWEGEKEPEKLKRVSGGKIGQSGSLCGVPAGTDNLAGRETWLWCSVAHGWGPGTRRCVERDSP